MLYQDAKKGQMLFIPAVGVSYRKSETCVLEKLEPGAIVLLKVGSKPKVLSSEEFHSLGYIPLTATIIAADYEDIV